MSPRIYPRRAGYDGARTLSMDTAAVIDHLAAARSAALLVWRARGRRQQRALVDLIPGELRALMPYPRTVRLALVREGLLEYRPDEIWELSPAGVEVKLAGARVARPQSRHK